jgi:hypothetical protein
MIARSVVAVGVLVWCSDILAAAASLLVAAQISRRSNSLLMSIWLLTILHCNQYPKCNLKCVVKYEY